MCVCVYVCVCVLVVPIPKKGDLSYRHCDNWCGISLLDVVGKILARIVKERLEGIAESVLPESQSGFRKGRSCVDMIFIARQLVEKTREHNDTLYMLFVDLKVTGYRQWAGPHGQVKRL